MPESGDTNQTVLIGAQELRSTIKDVFVSLGVPEEDAAYEAEILVDADLRGVDTHGALLMPKYVKKIQNGVFNTEARMSVVRESPTTLVFDADNGLGHVTTARTMEQC
ncbi:MAG: Ldh family oxidoreductase, partial [bacterium]